MRAHRLVCMLAHGLPDCWGRGQVDCVHLCDNKGCVNQLHLAWAARAVNDGAGDGSHSDDGGGDDGVAAVAAAARVAVADVDMLTMQG